MNNQDHQQEACVLEINALTKRYPRRKDILTVLDGVSLKLCAGEFAIIRGPSGSGKTTLLMAAGGLLAPDSGSVSVEGCDLYQQGSEARSRFRAANIGFVFQQFHLIPYLTILENIMAAGLIAGMTSAAARARGLELIANFGLESRATHIPADLSTGERQRTAMARALLNRPRLILADEPLGNLDEQNAAIVLRHLREYTQQGGCVLMVTHGAGISEDILYYLEAGMLRKATPA